MKVMQLSRLANLPTAHSPPFHFICTFWGRRYREWFTRFAVASLLAPNNIPGLDELGSCRFLICTTREDWDALEHEPLMVQLRKYVAVEFIEISPEVPGEHKYHRMSRGHRALTEACHRAGACAVYFAPDTVVPDGCVREALRLAKEGKKVVLCTAIRFELEGVERELAERGLLLRDKPLVLSRREAVDVGLRNLHTESRAGDYDADNFGALAASHNRTDFPTCCYFKIPDQKGVVIHTHNWAPFMINYAGVARHDTQAFERWAIDGDYIYRNFGDLQPGEQIHVVQDSDSIVLLGLTPTEEMAVPRRSQITKTLPIVGEWTKGYIVNQAVFDRQTDPLRRQIYPTPVRWHAQPIDARWDPTENRARQIMQTYATADLRTRATLARAIAGKSGSAPLRGDACLRFFWFLLVAGPSMSLHTYRRQLLIGRSYLECLLKAALGDPVERARIRKRARSVLKLLRV
jgi:hypothetical protein